MQAPAGLEARVPYAESVIAAGGLAPLRIDGMNAGRAGAVAQVLQELLHLGTGSLGDNLHGTAVRQVADVAAEAQEASAGENVIAEADALDAAANDGAEGDGR
jgi:hypothetical protein